MVFSPDSVPKKEQQAPVQESAPIKPVQSVAPQARDSSGFSAWESGNDSLVNLWDSSSGPDPNASQTSNLVDLMGDGGVPPSTPTAAAKPQPLLSFDEMMDATFCSAGTAEDDPASLVDVMGSDQMTLSYQHALQHASGEGKEIEDGQRLMTNGETLLKEGTQVRHAQNDPAVQSKTSSMSFSLIVSFCLSVCRYRPARAISANHRRMNSANQMSPRLSLRRSFIISHQVRYLSEKKMIMS